MVNPDNWVVGVVIYIFGTTCMALGANLQRFSLTKESYKEPGAQRTKIQQPVWVTGILMFICSGFFLSLGLIFATQTILAPMILFIFPSNSLFAHFLNGEPFRWGTDGVATAMIMVGVGMCELAAPRNSDYRTAAQFLELYASYPFIIFVVLWCSFTGGILYARHKILMAVDGNIEEITAAWKTDFLHLSYGAMAGALGAMCITLTKSVFELMAEGWKHDGFLGVIGSPLLWVVVVVLVSCYVMEMKWTVEGLESCSAMIAVPTQTVTEEIVAMFGGILYYQDFRKFGPGTGVLFALGNLIAVVSMIALAHFQLVEREKRRTTSPSGQSRMDFELMDENRAINLGYVKDYSSGMNDGWTAAPQNRVRNSFHLPTADDGDGVVSKAPRRGTCEF